MTCFLYQFIYFSLFCSAPDFKKQSNLYISVLYLKAKRLSLKITTTNTLMSLASFEYEANVNKPDMSCDLRAPSTTG